MNRFAVMNFSSVGPRANRFTSRQENKNPSANLFTRIFELLVNDRYAEAEEIIDQELLLDPLSGEAILAWTEVKICKGELDGVIERVESLRHDYPTNAYYFLCQVLLELEEWIEDPNFQSHIQMDYDDYVEQVAKRDGSSDVFAKIALASIRRGMWKTGMTYLVEAIKAKDRESDGTEDILFLLDKNSCVLERYLDCLPMLQDQCEPVYAERELVVKTVCLLLIAYEDLGICEAWPVAIGLANSSKVVARAWEDLSGLFKKWCPQWVQMRRAGGVRLVRARMFG